MSEFVVIDTETTGLDADRENVVEVSAVRFDTNVAVFGEFVPLASFTSLANPGRPIPPEASGVHLIADRHVAGAPPSAIVRARLAEFVGSAIVVAHHASFDRSFLPELDGNPWICSYRLARHLFTDAPNFKLGTLRFWLDFDCDELARFVPHRAYSDAMVTSRLFARELLACTKLGCATLDDVAAFTNAPLHVKRFDYGRKYRNVELTDIPAPYLEWVLNDAASKTPYMRVDDDTLHAVRKTLSASQVSA